MVMMKMMMMTDLDVQKSLPVATGGFVCVESVRRRPYPYGGAAMEKMYLLSCVFASCSLVSAEALLC